jgi:SAM-dependent methyltransferase
MNLSRDVTNKIHFVLDQLLPPIIRDSKLLCKFLIRLQFKNKTNVMMSFKDKVPSMSQKEFVNIYKETASVHPQRETDLNKKSEKLILDYIVNGNIIEVGCGRGYLSNILSQYGDLIATDMVISNDLKHKYKDIDFREANIENLPFEDNYFDNVVCTHTLEHVLNINQAISELRRVCKKRLIIVVPQQRPYKYTFDLHIRFFPYPHSLSMIMISNKVETQVCLRADGDLFYYEDKKA